MFQGMCAVTKSIT